MSDAALQFPYIVPNGRGGYQCSACSGFVRSDAKSCKHCHRSFYPDAAALTAAHTAYQDALKALRATPDSAELQQRALSIGRAYASMTRNMQGATIYDEMALMNDINAATAGTTTAAPAASIESRLANLETLRTKGLITAEEYNQKRQRLIDEM